jgi:hypothetical protein
MHTINKYISGLLLVILVSVTGVFAQLEKPEVVSDEELKQFASAVIEIQSINLQAQEKMINTVQDEGLEVQRFNEIQLALEDPGQDHAITEEELKDFESISEKLDRIQAEAEQEMIDKIKEEGLTENRYQEIAVEVQNDTILLEKLQAFLLDEQK